MASTAIQALVAPVLVQLIGMSTCSLGDGQATLFPSTEVDPNEAIAGTAAARVVPARLELVAAVVEVRVRGGVVGFDALVVGAAARPVVDDAPGEAVPDVLRDRMR